MADERISQRVSAEAIFCDHEPFRRRVEELEAERDALIRALARVAGLNLADAATRAEYLAATEGSP
jgi:hypothetical protein